ncbi:hypothetical protein MMC07_009932 [Pseudocyphellaria aurata]|nr:hypothetical protein [Pseudocyphellaria aurata]
MSDGFNANPTIRNASDLPSRRRQATVHQPSTKSNASLGLLTSTIPSSAYIPDPFSPSSSLSDGESLNGEDDVVEPIDEQEIYGCVPDLISPIVDPEHPLTLGSLSVVNLPDIHIAPLRNTENITVVTVLITPTITHCSLATVIGLGVRVRLEQALPPRFRVDVKIKEGTHSTAEAVTRQLLDKERVAAALENGTLMGVLKKMLEGCHSASI